MKNYDGKADEQLIQEYYGCDNGAWNTLDRRIREPLVGLLLKHWNEGRLPMPEWGSRLENAADFVAEALVKAAHTKHRKAAKTNAPARSRSGRFNPDNPRQASVRTWLFAIVWRCVLNYFRLNNPVVLKKDDWVSAATPADDDLEDLLQALAECFRELPDEWRTLCELWIERRLGQKAIAERIGAGEVALSRELAARLANRHIEVNREFGRILAHLRGLMQKRGFDIPTRKDMREVLEKLDHG